jgi:hypothetical protein
MNMNLVALAGVPQQDMSGKLVGVGGCGCSASAGMGAYARPVGATDAGAPSVAERIVPVIALTAIAGLAVWAIFRMEAAES